MASAGRPDGGVHDGEDEAVEIARDQVQNGAVMLDVNMAEAVTKLQQADTAYRAALGAVSTAERQSLLDYLR